MSKPKASAKVKGAASDAAVVNLIGALGAIPQLTQVKTDHSFIVTEYEIWLGAGLRSPAYDQNGSEIHSQWIQVDAIIRCSGADDQLLTVNFLSQEREKNTYEAKVLSGYFDPVRAVAYVPSEEYPWYLDLLRNQAPVKASIDTRIPFFIHLEYTGPAGEGELGV